MMAPASVLSRARILFIFEKSRAFHLSNFAVLRKNHEVASAAPVARRRLCGRHGHAPSLRLSSSAASAASAASAPSPSDPIMSTKREPRTIENEVTVVYQRGLPELTVPLPSRRELCCLRLRPVSHMVGDLVEMLKHEDRGIDRVAVTTIDGVRIGSSNSIESLMEKDFKLTINDNEYLVIVPKVERLTQEENAQLSDVRLLVTRLYESLNVQEHQLLVERQLLGQLEGIKTELAPMEEIAKEISDRAVFWVGVKSYAFLYAMGVQFGILARLTWWEYSWDIMEPVTYFVTYGTAMVAYSRSLITGQESAFGEVRSRHFLMTFYKLAAKRGLDVPRYNLLKESAYQIEKQLARLRDPLQVHLPVRPMEIPPPPSPSVLTRAQDQIRNLLKMRNKLTMSDSPKTQ